MIFDDVEKVKTTETNRDRIIYMMAIDGQKDLSKLDPPATDEEAKNFEEMSARMRKKEAEWPKDGPPLVWDIPFDID